MNVIDIAENSELGVFKNLRSPQPGVLYPMLPHKPELRQGGMLRKNRMGIF